VFRFGLGFSFGGLCKGDQDAGDTAKIRRVTPHTSDTYRTLASAFAVMEGSAQSQHLLSALPPLGWNKGARLKDDAFAVMSIAHLRLSNLCRL